MANKRLTVDIPAELMEEIKLMKVLHGKSMKEIVVSAIKLFAKQPNVDSDMKKLMHKIYRLEFERHTH